MNSESPNELAETTRVVVLAPRGRDAQLTRELLEAHAIPSVCASDIHDFCARLEEGVGTAIITEEMLDAAACTCLRRIIGLQPAWSDFQLIVFGDARPAHGDRPRTSIAGLGNVSFIDRPVGVREMLGAVGSALRARAKQYEARRAIHSRDQFLAMLGHELRNPLGAIQLAVQLEANRSNAASSRQIAVIERQARHLARLVDDLLDVARIASGKVVLKKTRLDLNEVLRACVQTVAHSARDNDLELLLSRAEQPVWVMGDSVRLEQVFGNLLTNAIKYTPRHGKVEIEVARELSTARASVRIIDSGIGIESAMLPRVFDMFAQADRSLDRAKGGMGLGLTLVQNLVRLHGGEVAAHSGGLGLGSVFLVHLPVAIERVHDDETRPRARRTTEPDSLRIVLVEDNEDVREMLQELLLSRRHQVSAAADGPSGVARILADQPDIAFVDLGLPGFDGFEVARQVRARDTSHVRLVAVTGYGQPEDRARAFAAGFDHQLTKPVNLDDLEAALRAKSSHGEQKTA